MFETSAETDRLHLDVPELGFSTATSSIRVPELRRVIVTSRIEKIIDHPAFQRLRRVRQLGPTHLVYPGATHTRFEHSLGVYACVRMYLVQLLRNPNFAASVTEADLSAVLLAGLLHDVGHYPFAHNLEALHQKGRDTPKHEVVGSRIILGEIDFLVGDESLATIIERDFKVPIQRVLAISSGEFEGEPQQIDLVLRSIISSAIDADKMDYLERDSIHMGVPYGRNFDRDRLLASLTLNRDETEIAVKSKGKVSAETFIFGRYTMFSEAYWHHTVRSSSAMLEAALAAFYSRTELDNDDVLTTLLSHDDDSFLRWLHDESPENSATRYLLRGVVHNRRNLHKRVLTLSRVYHQQRKRDAYAKIYDMEGEQVYELADRLRVRLSSIVGRPLHPADLIVDTPPRDKDNLETIDVVYDSEGAPTFYRLHELSRIVAGVQDDFMMVVKKIRLFAEPTLAAEIKGLPDVEDAILDEVEKSK